MTPRPIHAGPPARSSDRGSMLIVALGILSLMAVMAVTFVTLMKYEKAAAKNYIDSLRAKMAADAGMTRILANVKASLDEPYFQGGQLASHVFGANGKEIDVTIPVEAIGPGTGESNFFYGTVGRTYSTGEPVNFNNRDTVVGVDEYKVKVLDTSALFDLNYPAERDSDGKLVDNQVLLVMLDALGTAIARSKGYDPIKQARYSGPGGSFTGPEAILAYRRTLDGDRFSSKTQLRELFEPDQNGDYAYALLYDFVTAHAWRDVKAVIPVEGDDKHHAVRVLPGGRAQLNLNIAPKEVLVAAIAPLAGRRFTYLVTSQAQDIEAGNENNYFGENVARPADWGLQEDTVFDVREGWVYVGPIGIDRAEKIAGWIIENRPFLSTAHFHARLVAEMDKAVGQGALDTFLPQPQDAEGGARVVNETATNRQRFNLQGIHTQPWFARFVKESGYSLLLANFNPAFVSNSVNPSQAGYYPVDKASLLYPIDWSKPDPRSTIRGRQTFDACFDSRGVFELTSLGQILGPEGEIVAKEKVSTVVRTFDMEVHRTQLDFETNDKTYAGTGTGGPERFGITTWPETRFFFTANDASQKVDVPEPLVVRDYGHLELEPRALYYDGDQTPLRDMGGAGQSFGNPLFGACFDGFLKGLNPGAYLHANVGNTQRLGTPVQPDAWQRARGSAPDKALGNNPQKTHATPLTAPAPSSWYVTNGIGTLFRDGFYSTYRNQRDKTLWYRAGSDEDGDDEQGAKGQGTGATSGGDAKQGNVWYRQGGIEFWVKPDFDWAYESAGTQAPYPMVCGYLFASRVYYNPGDPSAQPVSAPLTDSPTDGTQLFLFRNSLGQIRATRMYFRVVGSPKTPEGEKPNAFVDPVPGDEYPVDGGTVFDAGAFRYPPAGGAEGGAIDVYREAAERRPDDPTTPDVDGYIWPPAEMRPDPEILRARTDCYVDFNELKDWKRGEWHHVAVAWDDSQQDSNQALRIYVDGVWLSKAHGLPTTVTPDRTDHQFVRLNEPPEVQVDGAPKRFPKDQLYVGGIERNLAVKGAGVFKHRNAILPGSGGGVPAGSTEEKRIRLFACGTVDDVIGWDLQGTGLPITLQGVPQRGRYETAGDYVQHFDLGPKFPGGNQAIQLARLTVTTLLPTHHGANPGNPNGLGSVGVKIDQPGGVRMRHPQTGSVVDTYMIDGMAGYQHVDLVGPDGQPAVIPPPANPNLPGPFLRYSLSLTPATFPAGGQIPQLRAVDTPVIQEVSLQWFLPTEETLLRERLID